MAKVTVGPDVRPKFLVGAELSLGQLAVAKGGPFVGHVFIRTYTGLTNLSDGNTWTFCSVTDSPSFKLELVHPGVQVVLENE
jgi:hypothetical protein